MIQNKYNKKNKINPAPLHIFNQSLQYLSEAMNSLIIRTTTQGIFKYVSPNSAYIFGYESSEMVGQKLTSYLHEKDKDRILQLFHHDSHLWENEKILTLRLRRSDGVYKWSELRIYLLKDVENNVSEVLYIIKEKPLASEESLLQSDKLAVIGQLAAGIAHEIRNPLTSLKGFIQLMKSDPVKNDHYLEIMEHEIDRIDSISNELLIFSSPNHSKFKKHDLQEILLSCLTLMEGQAYQKQISIVYKKLIKPIYVYCDGQKLKQVLINLIKNAVESMEEPGNITVTISNHGDEVILAITDEGCGIPEDLLDKLGQPFFTTKNSGNGLGLMMCYKIINEHHGKIKVESKLGFGTTFKIFLPLDE